MARKKASRIDPAAYRLSVRPMAADESTSYLATVPDLPRVMGNGETPEDAVRDVRIAITAYLRAMRAEGRPVVPPTRLDDVFRGKWVQRVPKSLHRSLVERARMEGVSLNTLVTSILSSRVASKDRAA